MEYDEILVKLGGAEKKNIAEALTSIVATASRQRAIRIGGDEVTALSQAKDELVNQVTWFLENDNADIEPVGVMLGSMLYAPAWAVAQILYEIDHPDEEDDDSETTSVPDLFLLGMMKANNDLSVKVLDLVAAMEKAIRAEDLIMQFEEMDKVLDKLKAPSRNEVDTRDLSVLERLDALYGKHRDDLDLVEDQNTAFKIEHDECMELIARQANQIDALKADLAEMGERYRNEKHRSDAILGMEGLED